MTLYNFFMISNSLEEHLFSKITILLFITHIYFMPSLNVGKCRICRALDQTACNHLHETDHSGS